MDGQTRSETCANKIKKKMNVCIYKTKPRNIKTGTNIFGMSKRARTHATSLETSTPDRIPVSDDLENPD